MDMEQPDEKTSTICTSLLSLIEPIQRASENVRAGKDVQKSFTLGFYTYQNYLVLKEASQSALVRHAAEQLEAALIELQDALALHNLRLDERPPWANKS